MLKQTNVAWNATDGLKIGFTGLIQRTDTDEISVEVNEDNLADYATKAELANASLETVQVVVVDATHIKLKFVFADGTSVESQSITLPRGPQGEQGPQGIQGPQGPQGEPREVVQATGTSTTAVMSQKAVTDAINSAIATSITTALNTAV